MKQGSVYYFFGFILFVYCAIFSRISDAKYCDETEYRCPNGTCIPLSKVQDGVDDCFEGKYDESGPFCDSSQLQCSNGNCVGRSKFNNSVNDCGDNSDEVTDPCGNGKFTCTNDIICFPITAHLNDIADCSDTSDEAKIIGTECSSGLSCCPCENYVPNSECYRGECRCLSGHYSNELGTSCIRRNVGDPCSSDSDCSDAYTFGRCINKICGCLSGHKRFENFTGCERRRIGDACSTNADCSSAVFSSICNGGKCQCISGYMANPENSICTKRKIGDSCSISSDCFNAVSSSKCSADICVCDTGYREAQSGARCQLRRIGDSCNKDSDCAEAVPDSECNTGECRCLPGYQNTSSSTMCTKRSIGDSCTIDADCLDAVSRSSCVNGSCICDSGYESVDGGKTCVKRPVLLEDRCYTTAQCKQIHPRSICDKFQRCTCQTKYFVFHTKDKCQHLPTRVGNLCNSNGQCQSVRHSKCSNYKCMCKEGFFSLGARSSRCQPFPKRLEGDCRADKHCRRVKNSYCWNGERCKCQYGFKPKHTARCDPVSTVPPPTIQTPTPHPGGKRQCTEMDRKRCNNTALKTRCLEGRCVCIPGYAYVAGTKRCKESQTYKLKFNVTGITDVIYKDTAPRYDSLVYDDHFGNAHKSEIMSMRITRLGIDELFKKINELKGRFLSSRVVNVTEANSGAAIEALIDIEIDIMNPMQAEDLHLLVDDYFNRTNGTLGISRLQVALPFNDTENASTDFDECADSRYNDCDSKAWCFNTMGSFLCICQIPYIDKSDDLRNRGGRICGDEVEEKRSVNGRCGTETCDTNWALVGFALTGFLLLLFGLIGYEVYSRKRELDEREAYTRFGRPTRRPVRKSRRRKRSKTPKRKKKGKNSRNSNNISDSGPTTPDAETTDPGESGEAVFSIDDEMEQTGSQERLTDV